MRYYLIKEAEEFKIMKVRDESINVFLRGYSSRITFASDSLQLILQKINESGPLQCRIRKASEGLRTIHECRFSDN